MNKLSGEVLIKEMPGGSAKIYAPLGHKIWSDIKPIGRLVIEKSMIDQSVSVRSRQSGFNVFNFLQGLAGSYVNPTAFDSPAFDLIQFLEKLHIPFSIKTFGPGLRTQSVLDRILKELDEVAKTPSNLEEWVDIITLAMDGALRMGFTPGQICQGLISKNTKNANRKWPDWKTAAPGKAIEHTRDETE